MFNETGKGFRYLRLTSSPYLNLPSPLMPKILIIDDEKSIRNTLKEILEYESYAVDQAEDGPSGLDMLIKNKYDVVLCDIKMPKMDGLEVLSRAQACEDRHLQDDKSEGCMYQLTQTLFCYLFFGLIFVGKIMQ